MNVFTLMQSFEAAGFRFYEFGTLSDGCRKVADYYKGDTISAETRAKLLASVPGVYFLGSCKQYAPELKSSLVCIPKRQRARKASK